MGPVRFDPEAWQLFMARWTPEERERLRQLDREAEEHHYPQCAFVASIHMIRESPDLFATGVIGPARFAVAAAAVLSTEWSEYFPLVPEARGSFQRGGLVMPIPGGALLHGECGR